MEQFNASLLKNLYKPPADSHKGQNGKLMIIGGSKLFHAASLWSLKVASRIVDMVYYSSVDENNQIVKSAKEEFRDGIVVKRSDIDSYIQEADCILIGPGLPRPEGQEAGDDDTKELTERLFKKYADKRWVIDGGSLQTMDPKFIPKDSILTPHSKEFDGLFKSEIRNPKSETISNVQNTKTEEIIKQMAKKYNCTILLKGAIDIVCSPFDSAQGETRCVRVSGGNAGMTKGGTGDVLAGLVASVYCKNSAFLSACAGSYINKKAGGELFEKVGYYFNSSDLTDEIPKVMKQLLIK
jgi:NAD(P)H-hydrate epimerase